MCIRYFPALLQNSVNDRFQSRICAQQQSILQAECLSDSWSEGEVRSSGNGPSNWMLAVYSRNYSLPPLLWHKVTLKGLCDAIFLLNFPVVLFLRAINFNMWMEYSFNDGILTQQTQMISKHSYLPLVYLKNVGPSFFRNLLSNFDHPHFFVAS